MPIPGGFDDRPQFLILGNPIQNIPCESRVGDQFRWIACPSRPDHFGDLATRDLAANVNHLSHTVADSRAQVDFDAATRLKPIERCQMRGAQIIDVNIISHAGTIRGWIIVAKNRNVLPLTQRGLENDRYQMRFGIVILTDIA